MLRTFLFTCLLMLAIPYSRAQNAFGALHSNYSPTNSLYINPSSILDAKTWLDINLVGAGSYVNNDLVYLEDERGMTLISEAIRGDSRLEDDDIRYNQSRNKYHAYNRNFVAGPSAVWSQGDFAAGISTGVRSFTDARRIPDYVAQFIENGVQDYTVQHDIDYSLENARVASMNFGEIKLTYAQTFLKSRQGMWMGGITFSKYFSIGGAGLNIYDFDFNVDDDTLAVLENLDADAMYTSEAGFKASGGWGIDLGFTYQHMLGDASTYYPNSKRNGCTNTPYLYKIGVSIMDIGHLKFEEDDVLFAGYDFENFDWYNYANATVDDDNVTTILEDAESSIDEGRVKKPWRMSMPTFVSAQFDYNVWASRVYVNATLVQGLSAGKNRFGARHANSLSVTPRYESYWLDFALPFSMYEYRYAQLGASLRLGPITLGTDKLLNWIAVSDIYGADLYFYVKIPIRYNPECRRRMKDKAGGSLLPWKRKGNPTTRCTI